MTQSSFDNVHYSPVQSPAPILPNFKAMDYSPYGFSPQIPFPGAQCLCSGKQIRDGVEGCSICGAKWRVWRWKYTCGLCELHVCSSCAGEVRMCPERESGEDQQHFGESEGNLVAQRVCDLCITSEAQGNAKVLNPAAAFAVLDRNINDGSAKGKVSAAGLKQIMMQSGRELSRDEVEDLVIQADFDHTGDIDYAAFVKWMDTRAHAEASGSVDAV